MKNAVKNNVCPVCSSNSTRLISIYRSNRPFLSVDNLCKCDLCELVYCHPLPSDSELNDYYEGGLYYDIVSDPADKSFTDFSYKIAKSRLSLILRKVELSDEARVLDIGAGNGQFGRALKEISSETEYYALDPDPKCINSWGEWVDRKHGKLNEIERNSIDLVVMNQVLEHVTSPIEFIETIKGLLRLGGYLYTDVPNGDHRFKPTLEPHTLFFSITSLSRAVELAAMEMIYCDTAGMKIPRARTFFGHSIGSNQKLMLNPWKMHRRVNSVLRRIGVNLDEFSLFQSDRYGGDRNWIRCIARRID